MTDRCKCCGTPKGKLRRTHTYRGVCIGCRDTRSPQVIAKAVARPDQEMSQ